MFVAVVVELVLPELFSTFSTNVGNEAIHWSFLLEKIQRNQEKKVTTKGPSRKKKKLAAVTAIAKKKNKNDELFKEAINFICLMGVCETKFRHITLTVAI